jgi:ADP-heptose:LPS heptosyltransferase
MAAMSFSRRPPSVLGTWITRLVRRDGFGTTRADLADWPRLIAPDTVKRILVLKPHDQLGDFMVATPALAALRADFPAARIILVTRPFLADLAHWQPDIDEVWVVPRISGPKDVAALVHLLVSLIRLQPELAFVLNSVSRSRTADALAALSRPRLLIGRSRVGDGPLPGDAPKDPIAFVRHLLQMGLIPDAIYDMDIETMATSEHQSARAVDLALAAAACAPWQRMRLQVPAAERAAGLATLERVWASASPAMAPTPGTGATPRWIGIHPGAANPLKCWPLDRFVELGVSLATGPGTRESDPAPRRIVVFDSPRESGRALAVRDGLLARGVPAGLVPAGAIGAFAAIAAHLSLLVCNDSGVMHIAAALDVPTVSFHALGRPAEWAPANGRSAAFYADHAIETLPVAPALEAAERLLAEPALGLRA